MEASPVVFFSSPETQTLIHLAHERLGDSIGSGGDVAYFRSMAQLILARMKEVPSRFDAYCPYNVEKMGPAFINALRNYNTATDPDGTKAEEILCMAYRFASELMFISPSEPDEILTSIKNGMLNNWDKFRVRGKESLTWANMEMPIHMARQLIHHENIDSVKGFLATSVKAEQMKQAWEADLATKEGKLKEVSDRLAGYETAFNFVGLHKAFSNLAGEKKQELKSLRTWLITFAVAAFVPLFAEIAVVTIHLEKMDVKTALFTAGPIIAIELLLIYFFRILLVNHKSVKAQLLQLDVRKALCEFIQSYTEYSKQIKEKDNTTLEKFENLIFSGIVANEENLPTTFDGAEKIAEFFKSIK